MQEGITDQQINSLLSDLKSLKEDLESQLAIKKETTKTVVLDQTAFGRLSRMDAIAQQKMAQANKKNAEARLKQVNYALKLIEIGNYGECSNCGECISFKRLKAKPESIICIECKQLSEK